jgi:hypothetical protein
MSLSGGSVALSGLWEGGVGFTQGLRPGLQPIAPWGWGAHLLSFGERLNFMLLIYNEIEIK